MPLIGRLPLVEWRGKIEIDLGPSRFPGGSLGSAFERLGCSKDGEEPCDEGFVDALLTLHVLELRLLLLDRLVRLVFVEGGFSLVEDARLRLIVVREEFGLQPGSSFSVLPDPEGLCPFNSST